MRRIKSTLYARALSLVAVAFAPGIADAVVGVSECPENDAEDVVRQENVDGRDGDDKLLKPSIQEDQKGNVVETWCLNGSQFGRAYKPNGAARVWVGKCPPPKGRNQRDKTASEGDFDVKGKPPGWDRLSYLNNESEDLLPVNGVLDDWDWHYFIKAGTFKYKDASGADKEIAVPAGKLVTRKTKCVEVDANGYCKSGKDQTVGDPEVGDPPAKPQDLSFGGAPIDPPDEPHFDIEQPVVSLQLVTAGSTSWTYALRTPGDEFFSTPITSGSTVTIYGCNITGASVTGAALLAANGAWRVLEFNRGQATWIATEDSADTAAAVIDGFVVETLPTAAAPVGWKALGSISYNSLVSGPRCPKADQLHVVGPIPNQVPSSTPATISAAVRLGRRPVSGAAVIFTRVLGDVAFMGATVSPDGASASASTDGNGRAAVAVVPKSAGAVLVKVTVARTGLSAFSYFVGQ